MILSVIEPGYFLPIESCAKALAADVVIWADTFIFKKHSTINRAAIKTVSGRMWLTVPVLTKGLGQQSIRDVQIDRQQKWQQRHWRTLTINYRNAPYYYFFADELEHFFKQNWIHLSELLWHTCLSIFNKLGVENKLESSSRLPQIKDKTLRVMDWLNDLNCKEYLLWPQEIALLDLKLLAANGVRLHQFFFKPQHYYQQVDGFISSLSILDLILNEGPYALKIIKDGMRLESFR